MALYIKRLICLLFLVNVLSGVIGAELKGQSITQDSITYYTSVYKTAKREAKIFPDESLIKLDDCLAFFRTQSDSFRIVQSLVAMADIQSKKGKYSLSFDLLWEAQYISQIFNNKKQQAAVQIQLGRLYDNFNMVKQVLFHYNNALKVAKEIYFENDSDLDNLIASYMNLSVRHRKSGEYDLALSFLDSCFVNDWVIQNNSNEMPFIDAERGYIMLKLGQYEKAYEYLIKAIQNTWDKNVTYLPNINMYMGEYYRAINQPDSSIMYYTRSLNLIRNRNIRTDLEADVLYQLSEVYSSIGKIHRAYSYIDQSKFVADSIMRLKNETNSELFKIKNTYLESISEKNELLETQSIVIAQNKQIQLRLKIILSLVVLLGGGLFIVIRTRMKLKRTLLEKTESELKSSLLEEKAKSELELKSKELTSYALQLIDKDTAIDELLEALKKESKSSYKILNNKLKKGSKDLWDEFNLRFTEVNSAFYDRLKMKHPALTVTEQKHCALIKLRFSTKDMARILNIEIHSVHMSRSRIRRKMKLERAENLENYIADL